MRSAMPDIGFDWDGFSGEVERALKQMGYAVIVDFHPVTQDCWFSVPHNPYAFTPAMYIDPHNQVPDAEATARALAVFL
jgi:hypothetical protein